jgi:hypothetical protein
MVREMNDEWSNLPRFSKLASAMFPDQVSPERRAEMDKIARGEKRQLRGPGLLSHEARGAVSPLGNVAKGWPEIKPKGK